MPSLGKRQADAVAADERTEKKRRREESKADDAGAIKEKKSKKEKKEKSSGDKKDKKEKKDKKDKKDKKSKSSEVAAALPTPESSTPSSPPALSSPPRTFSYTQHAELSALSKSDLDAFNKKHTILVEDPAVELTPPNLHPVTEFKYLPDSPGVRSGFFDSFKTPTPIQSATWPYLLLHRDVVGIAETGSGKTIAFGLPCIRDVAAASLLNGGRVDRKASVRAVILSPTRELALQIHSQLDGLADHAAGIHVACLYGGAPKDEQRQALKKASVAIGTPGRLKDLLSEDPVRFSNVRYLVLDEADRMLDKGFEEELKAILELLPKPTANKPRQTVMFTATWPTSIQRLAGSYMTSPVKITVGQHGDPDAGPRANLRISQSVEVMDPRAKENRLLAILRDHEKTREKKDRRVLVFCLYKKEAARVEQNLQYRGISAVGIHGDMTQPARLASLAAFKDGSKSVLVATDVAARGLDIPDVALVINVTFPLTIEDYVHRIGRTGRAGKEGKAITFFTEHDKTHSGTLINVLKGANQPVPDDLFKFGTTVKKKEHSAYGAFYRDTKDAKASTKITFD